MKLSIAFLLFLAASALAADITGTWKGSAQTQNGTIERTFIFRQEGDKLTGETVSERFGKSTIDNGRVEGDTVTFTVNLKVQDNDMKLNYKGKVEGNQMKLHVTSEGADFSFEYVAKKIS
jgi:hypothetical protein